jgi:DNA-binding FadR family transcriptional regulator
MLIPRQTVRPHLEDPEARTAYLRRVREEHARIAAAIASGDAASARDAMRQHLSASRDRYAGLAGRLAALDNAPLPR